MDWLFVLVLACLLWKKSQSLLNLLPPILLQLLLSPGLFLIVVLFHILLYKLMLWVLGLKTFVVWLQSLRLEIPLLLSPTNLSWTSSCQRKLAFLIFLLLLHRALLLTLHLLHTPFPSPTEIEVLWREPYTSNPPSPSHTLPSATETEMLWRKSCTSNPSSPSHFP